MRKLFMQMNLTLDGSADHEAGIADDELHDFFTGLLDDIDLELFGRITYQLMESYWPRAHQDPAASASIIRFADKFNALPKIVFSNTLQRAEWNNTRLVTGDAAAEVRRLKREPGGNMSIGGISICRDFLRLGLIDEMWLLMHPVIWGKGPRLFEGLERKINPTLVDTKRFASGVMVLHYTMPSS